MHEVSGEGSGSDVWLVAQARTRKADWAGKVKEVKTILVLKKTKSSMNILEEAGGVEAGGSDGLAWIAFQAWLLAS